MTGSQGCCGHMREDNIHGWRVVSGSFVLAAIGLGFGFYGPAVFLNAIREARGWSLPLVSTAVTTHFLIGAIVTANLPEGYRRFGIPKVTKVGALSLALGVFGWATAKEPWQLFAATILSGAGWVTMGVAAVNSIISPWFDRDRPAALAMAYNGANVGGIIFPALWVAAIGALGFPLAAFVLGFGMVAVSWLLADLVFARSPETGAVVGGTPKKEANLVSASALWRDRKFLTLSAGMSLGLFAQIGLSAHLFSLLLPALGKAQSGLAMGLVAAMAVAGRTMLGWVMAPKADWRLVACGSYALQIVGSISFIFADGDNVPLLLIGLILFGLGFGNGTFLPPLIAQIEFPREQVARVVALCVAIAQGTYSFAPATFGLIREFASSNPVLVDGAVPGFYAAALLMQGLAIGAFFAGRP